MRGGLRALAALLFLVPAAWFATLVWHTPPLIVLAATLPAACWVGLVRLVDRPEREPWHAVAATFLWGAVVAAWASYFANEHLQTWLGEVAGWERARTLTSALGGPLVEETAKTLALVAALAFWWRDFDGVLDGMVYGALVGMGFALSENVTYFTLAAVQGGEPGLIRAVYLRAILGGCNHALFTATVGAGLGWARRTASPTWRSLAPPLAFLVAVGQHIAWNAVASGRITDALCNPATPGGACRPDPAHLDLFVTIPTIVALFVGPGVIVLAIVAALARRPAASNLRS